MCERWPDKSGAHVHTINCYRIKISITEIFLQFVFLYILVQFKNRRVIATLDMYRYLVVCFHYVTNSFSCNFFAIHSQNLMWFWACELTNRKKLIRKSYARLVGPHERRSHLRWYSTCFDMFMMLMWVSSMFLDHFLASYRLDLLHTKWSFVSVPSLNWIPSYILAFCPMWKL